MYSQRRITGLIFILLLPAFFIKVSGQEPGLKTTMMAGQNLASRGEVIIRFIKPSNISLEHLTTLLSIDDVKGDTVYAYANAEEFRQFENLNISYEIIPHQSIQKSKFLKTTQSTDWRYQYPTYTEYINLMEGFTTSYPDLCNLVEFGTSIKGHKLLALKISDNVMMDEDEPVLLYTSSIHGDEPLGYFLMLRLIDHLLANYSSDNEIRNIIDNLEIYINPLANPDGTYFESDTSIFGAVRYNMNHIDLNRNFPDIRYGIEETPDIQPENLAMIHFMKEIKPALSANFHGGAEVVNYPWDTWRALHPNDLWYRQISRAYADTAQFYGHEGYMTYLDNGITNGYDWYPVYRGRQDYVDYALNGHEVTIELSFDKILPEDVLNNYWNYNKASLLQYIKILLSGTPSKQHHPFPNPFDDIVYIDIPGKGFLLKVAFFDLTGRKVGFIQKQVTVAGLQEISTHDIKPGMYILQFTYPSRTEEFIMMKR